MFKFLLIGFVFFTSCYSSRVRNGDSVKSLPETSIIEYNTYFADGTKYKLLGNLNQAIICFARCAEINPSKSGPYFQLSEIYSLNNDFHKALLFAKRAYQYDKTNQWYILQLAKLYQKSGNIDSTIFLYKQLVKFEPHKEEYCLNLSFLYFKKGKSSQSVDVLTSFVKSNYLSEEIAVSLYQIYNYRNDKKNSLQILKLANQKFPDEIRFYGLLAEHYLSIKQMDSAYLYYKKLLDIDPANDRGLLSLIEYYRANSDTANYLKLSKAFITNPDYELKDKIDLLDGFINDNNYRRVYKPEINELLLHIQTVYPGNLMVYLLYADFYLRLNEQSLAADKMIYIVENFTVNYAVWERLLFTLNTLGLYTQLAHFSSLAYLKFPDKALPYLLSGIANYSLKSYSEAIIVLLKGLKYVKPNNQIHIQFYTYLGESYQSIAEYEKSEYYFEKVIQDDKKNVLILNNYSYYLALRNKNLDKALQYSKICVQNSPNSSTFLDTYAWILYKQGQYSEAKNTIEKALQIDSFKNPDIIEHYCEILFYSGDKINALKYYRLLEEKGKNSQPLKKLLQIE